MLAGERGGRKGLRWFFERLVELRDDFGVVGERRDEQKEYRMMLLPAA